MKILALDAALGFFSVALDVDGTLTSERAERNDALEAGLERVARLLAGAGIGLRDLDRLAVGLGPGSFTGIRIALSFAKALAFGASVPLVGISSYDALEPIDVPRPCLTVVAGRPGIICARLRRADGSTEVACGQTAEVIGQLTGDLARGTVLSIVTNTEDAVRATGEGERTVQRLISPAVPNAAVAIAHLARRHEPADSPHAPAPDYGERPAVSIPKARAILTP